MVAVEHEDPSRPVERARRELAAAIALVSRSPFSVVVANIPEAATLLEAFSAEAAANGVELVPVEPDGVGATAIRVRRR